MDYRLHPALLRELRWNEARHVENALNICCLVCWNRGMEQSRISILYIERAKCSGVGQDIFFTQCYGSGYKDPYLWLTIRIRILLFSSVTFKTPTKNIVFSSFFAYYFLNGTNLHKSSKIKSHKEAWLWKDPVPDPEGPKPYGSGSTAWFTWLLLDINCT